VTPWNFTKIFGIKKPESLGYHVAVLGLYNTFSHLDTILACDGQASRSREDRLKRLEIGESH